MNITISTCTDCNGRGVITPHTLADGTQRRGVCKRCEGSGIAVDREPTAEALSVASRGEDKCPSGVPNWKQWAHDVSKPWPHPDNPSIMPGFNAFDKYPESKATKAVKDAVAEFTAKHSQYVEMLCAAFVKLCPDLSPMDVELVQENKSDCVVCYFREKL